MGMLKWLMKKGPVGTAAREIGDAYVRISKAHPGHSPEQVVDQVGIPFGWQSASRTTGALRALICKLVEQRTGKDPRTERWQDIQKEGTDAKLAAEIITEELSARKIPNHLFG